MVQSQKEPVCRFPESIRRQHYPDGQDPHQAIVEMAAGGICAGSGNRRIEIANVTVISRLRNGRF
jgi:hypothetical protein